jgi:hypothetical protein
VRKLFGVKLQNRPERYDPWNRLKAPTGIVEAQAIVTRAAAVAALGLSHKAGGPSTRFGT